MGGHVFIEGLLCLLGCSVSDGAVEALGVVPANPFQGFPFNLANRFPRAEEGDNLSFKQADDAFGQRVIITVADASHGGVYASICQPLGVLDR